jgi:methyl-accepting chemotaxis protein
VSPRTTDAAIPDQGSTAPAGGVRPPFWRRRVIVDPAFQYSLIARTVVHTLVVLALVSAGLFGPILLDSLGEGQGADFADHAIAMVYMHVRFWWIALLSIVLVALDAVRVSHRIAGPLVPLKRNLRALGEGRLPETLYTRPNDYLKQEVEIVNEAVDRLAQRIEAIRSRHAGVVAGLRRCAGHLEAGEFAAARGALGELAAGAREVETLLARFERVGAREPAVPAAAAVPAHGHS